MLFGALVRMSVPVWVPYTVFIMSICCVIGVISHNQHIADTCPHHVFKKAGSDLRVSRAEWGEFLCEGCHPDSYCLASQPFGKRTCGDGSVETPGGGPVGSCRYTFDQLDTSWKQTAMVTEAIKSGAGDGYLSADDVSRVAANGELCLW